MLRHNVATSRVYDSIIAFKHGVYYGEVTVNVLNDRKDPIGTSFKEGGTLAKEKEKEKGGGK